jgi:hypothetical protein
MQLRRRERLQLIQRGLGAITGLVALGIGQVFFRILDLLGQRRLVEVGKRKGFAAPKRASAGNWMKQLGGN